MHEGRGTGCAFAHPFAAITALVFTAIAVCGNASAIEKVHTVAPGVLRVGTYFVNPPLEYVAKGKKIGFEIDLINEIGHRLHLRPQFVNTKSENILQQMQDGRYDCIVGGISITPARQQILAWSDPYLVTTLGVVIDSANTPQISSLADLKDAVVGVQSATTDYNAAISMQIRGEVKNVKVYPFDRIADAMSDLAARRITAVVKVYPVAAWLARQTPGLRILGQIPHQPQPLGIGLSKNDIRLVGAINSALAEMKQDGTYARLAKKWHVL